MRFRFNLQVVIGVFFVVTGLMFFVTCLGDIIREVLAGTASQGSDMIAFLSMAALALVFVASGGFMCAHEFVWIRHKRQLVKQGSYVVAVVEDVVEDPRIRINYKRGTYLVCTWYNTATDRTYTFNSDTFFDWTHDNYIGREVRVYIDPLSGYQDYVVLYKDAFQK